MQLDQVQRLADALEGIPIWGCIPGSASAEAGVRAGDVLLWANGVRVKTFPEYVRAKRLATDAVTLIVFRNGEEVPLTIKLHLPPVTARQILDACAAHKVIPLMVDRDTSESTRSN